MSKLTPYQETMLATWKQHGYAEFIAKDPDAAIATMADDTYIMAVPLGQLIKGRRAVHSFYANDFLPKIPADFEFHPVRQIIGEDHIADEFVCRFTHSMEMPWKIPGVPPTGRKVEVFMIAIVGFKGDKMAYEHLMWDHASVLSQIGVLEGPAVATLGKTGAAQILQLAAAAKQN